MPTVDLPGIRSISTDSACMARHRSSSRFVIFEYFTPAFGLNSKVVTTGPGWICTTEPSTANSRHFSSSSRARSISSRSSNFRCVLGASSRASGGRVWSPLRRSAGAFAIGSGSGTGRGGIATFGLVASAFRRMSVARDWRPADAGRHGRFSSSSSSSCRSSRSARLTPRAPSSDGAREPLGERLAPGVLISGVPAEAVANAGSGVPFFTCFAMTSRRCFSRRRSSRHSRNDSNVRLAVFLTARTIAPKKRPNENCVDMMIARKKSVRITITEPVRLR